MNRDEAGRLMAFCKSYDQRELRNEEITAWAAALADVPLDKDVKAAVVEFYTAPSVDGKQDRSRRFIQPYHVVAIRRKIRTERIRKLPMPAPNEVPGVSEKDELLAIERAIGDGKLKTLTDLYAYEKWGGSLHQAWLKNEFPELPPVELKKTGPIKLPKVFPAPGDKDV